MRGKPEEKQAVLERVERAMLAAVPYNAALGLRVEDIGPGHATLRLGYRSDLVGNPETGVLHGGVVTGLIDATCGVAVFLGLEQLTRIATLDLRIDYLRPATPALDVRARADCVKVTRRVAFVRALAYHDDPADPVAAAAGTFMIFDHGRSPFDPRAERKP